MFIYLFFFLNFFFFKKNSFNIFIFVCYFDLFLELQKRIFPDSLFDNKKKIYINKYYINYLNKKNIYYTFKMEFVFLIIKKIKSMKKKI